jgi:hypothetical protein
MLLPLIAAALLAGTPTVNLDKLLAKPRTQVRSQTKVAILLPKKMPVPSANFKLYASATGSRDRYAFRVTSTPDCSANFCYAASFSAQKGGAIARGGRTLTLAKGRKARYWPMACGASCAPASITWRERGATYTIEAMIALESNQKKLMSDMANSAIKRGPR